MVKTIRYTFLADVSDDKEAEQIIDQLGSLGFYDIEYEDVPMVYKAPGNREPKPKKPH